MYQRSLSFCLATAVLVMSAIPLAAQPATRSAPEYNVKAALLLKFLEMVRWPPDAPSKVATTVTICTIGDDPFGSALQAINGRTVQGKTVVTLHVRHAEDVRQCALLFLGTSGSTLGAAIRRYSKLPILTVGEAEGFIAAGGMIGFRMEQGRVRFDVNEQAATSAGLALDPKLLAASKQLPTSGGGR